MEEEGKLHKYMEEQEHGAGCPSVFCKYVLLQLFNSEAVSVYGKAEYSQVVKLK